MSGKALGFSTIQLEGLTKLLNSWSYLSYKPNGKTNTAFLFRKQLSSQPLSICCLLDDEERLFPGGRGAVFLILPHYALTKDPWGQHHSNF